MRIVQVIPDFALGGINKGGCSLGKAMAARGHEVVVVGMGPGPRYLPQPQGSLQHRISGPTSEDVFTILNDIRPDVVHIHWHRFQEPLVLLLRKADWKPMVVSTPVFGRAPVNPDLLHFTRVCLVGTYCFWRFCGWMQLSPKQAVDQGIGYVPITPFEPPGIQVAATDDPAIVRRRRARYGIPDNAFVVGRLGREDGSKWNDLNSTLVNDILSRFPDAYWLSIGFPAVKGRQALVDRWGKRFINLPETGDYEALLDLVSSLDVQAFFGHGECFASSIAESAGVGVPTIALANPLRDNGQAEQVIDGFNGFLVTSPEQAADRVGQIIADPPLLAKMKVQARNHCLERWHITRAADDLLSLYRYWIEKTTPPPYADVMIRETLEFGEGYRPRLVRLLGNNPLSRLKWNVLLKAVESPKAWRVGRILKRKWEKYRHGLHMDKIEQNEK